MWVGVLGFLPRRCLCSLAERVKNWSQGFFVLSAVISDLTCVFSGASASQFSFKVVFGAST